MVDVSLFQAWNTWLAGQKTESLIMWGHPIWWWGRVGKLLQFAAAITIIAEIIGAERIRQFGHSLHGKLTLTKTWQSLRLSWIWSRSIFSDDSSKYVPNLTAERLHSPLRWLVVALGFYLIIFYWDLGWIGWVLLPVWFFLGLTVAPIIVMLVMNCFAFAGLLIDLILIEPAAWIIDREHPDKWIKIGSILLLLAGFHFDLLAS